ncbi:MAG: MEDS domain-containing protein [Ignavibacteria bacterium]
MCAGKSNIDYGFTEEHFPEGIHLCLIYSNDEERKKIISQFLKSGITHGEKVAYFADELPPGEVIKWLAKYNVIINNENNSGQFSVSAADQTYCPNGTFDPEVMLLTLKTFYLTAKSENFPNSRVSGEMTWALKGIPGSDRLMEYESKVNNILMYYPVTAVCQYNVNKFDGAAILECLKVHPYMIAKGQIVQNPYYLKPEEYLKEKLR